MKKKIVTIGICLSIGFLSPLLAQTIDTKLSLSDKKATAETKILYHNLKKLTQKGILFGHQDDLAYGVNWRYEGGRSDVKEVTGDYPAVYGWDLSGLERKSDKKAFQKQETTNTYKYI